MSAERNQTEREDECEAVRTLTALARLLAFAAARQAFAERTAAPGGEHQPEEEQCPTRFSSLEELASRWGVSVKTLRRIVQRGELKTHLVHPGRRSWCQQADQPDSKRNCGLTAADRSRHLARSMNDSYAHTRRSFRQTSRSPGSRHSQCVIRL